MKMVEEVRDRHPGEIIYAAGAGVSMDKYPLDFFKDSVVVGVNFVFSVFLDVGDGLEKFKYRKLYSVHYHREPADWLVRWKPDFLKNCFFVTHPEADRKRLTFWKDYNDDPYWMTNAGTGHHRILKDLPPMAKCIMEKKGICGYIIGGTTLHWAIEAAVVLGAKKVRIVGGSGPPGYMKEHGSFYRNHVPCVSFNWILDSRAIARVFKPYGVEIVFHQYDKGEEIIT